MIHVPDTVKVPHAVGKERSQIIAGLRKLGIDAKGQRNKFITNDTTQRAEVNTAIMAASPPWDKYNVLILGETGTGKELIAELISERYQMSRSATALLPFKPVNCSAIVDNLFESELFGHVKGAFTGAINDRTGILQSAGDGTVFLDELGDLPLTQQAKLLRVIQSRRITPVGSTDERVITCRFIFATNKNLPHMVATGQFRADLYYRVAEIVVRTFPLRDRPEDAKLIAEAIIERNNWTPLGDFQIPLRWYSNGNVRDLQRCLLWREMGLEPDDINAELTLEDEQAKQP